MGRLFGTDGVRGEANRFPVDACTVLLLGQAVASRTKVGSRRPRLVVGRDTRLSGPMLEAAFQAGAMALGADVYLAGVIPTPAVAFLARSLQADAGVVISASHNPYSDNGVKLFSEMGMKLSEEEEAELERLVLDEDLVGKAVRGADIGSVRAVEDAEQRYVEFVKSSFPSGLSMKGLKVVLDPANGAAYRVGPQVLTELGAEVTVIHAQPDGLNINEDCGAQHPGSLAKAVVDNRADLGLALDGDGDRLIVVDEKGRRLTGDHVLLLAARMLKEEGRLRNDLVVSTVMSNLGLRAACKKYGFVHHETGVGDRQVVQDLLRLGGTLGGEESGHIVFLDLHTTGDGLLAGVQVIIAMLRTGQPLSELADWLEVYPQRLVNVPVRAKPSLSEVTGLREAVAEAEAELGSEGRVLIRYSGTEQVCRVMVEAPSGEQAERWAGRLSQVIQAAIGRA